MSNMTRRDFLMTALSCGVGSLLLNGKACALSNLIPVDIKNPLESYPDRDWEKVYRDVYHFDNSFTFICAPNDTHICRLRAFVRNGVVLRTEQDYGNDLVADIYGNKLTAHWNPRGCLKGFTVHRRVYGPYRAKGPTIRKGWKQWADAGFPSLSDKPELRGKYMFNGRGEDEFVRVTWKEAFDYTAKGLMAIAKTYSGIEGKKRLLEKDKYEPETLEHWHEAGTRTMKLGSSLPLHGVIGKFGIFRFANMLGLLDAHARDVKPELAQGAREWTEYTWRGDQAPGAPFVTGLQTSDCDFSDLRHSRLLIQCGKNLVENKMADSHWYIELMERGGKLVTIAPDYSAPAAKSDYWIQVRAGLSDTSIFLYVAKTIIENNHTNEAFVKNFTDFPLLIRTDTLKRVRPEELVANYQLADISQGPSERLHGLTAEQRKKIGDFVVMDKQKGLVAITRDDVGKKLAEKGIDPVLSWKGKLKDIHGKEFEAMTIYEGYKINLADYDLKTVSEITGADPGLIEQLARDFVTIKPIAIHIGEGINHYFHATLHNRAEFLPMILLGEIGKPGAGVFTWAGNYKGGAFQGAGWAGHGAGIYIGEDPFNPATDPNTPVPNIPLRKMMKGEEVAYWATGDKPLIVNTPKGRKVFTGKTHMPSPTKLMWYNNANLLNQAKWHYNIIQNVQPKVDMVIDQQIEWTGSAEYADIVLPANSWLEFDGYECCGSCSNPFMEVWKGGISPVFDSKDDAAIFAGVADSLSKLTGDKRFSDYWKFITEKKESVYLDRLFASCTTTQAKDGKRYTTKDILDGKYGVPGRTLMLYRTYPRNPFYEQVNDSLPFYTDSGRLAAYCDLPEAIEYGENFIVHREGPEATPYLPNVIVSTNPLIRPESYGIPIAATDANLRQVRNVKLAWKDVRKTKNPLWQAGFRFYCSTPKSRHSVHSSWSVVDWNWIWSVNSGDPTRADKRAAGVGDREIMVNPKDAKALGLDDGDYCWVDANPADRPYIGWQNEKDALKKRTHRCMVRVKYNRSCPPGFTIMKHTGWMASSRTVKAQETRPDGRAYSENTGYQASYRYGSHQSITRSWLMPMHQTDSFFHKKVGSMEFVFGFDVDNHAVNTVPKETLVRLTKAEPGGINKVGKWAPANSPFSPASESPMLQAYLQGKLTQITKIG